MLITLFLSVGMELLVNPIALDERDLELCDKTFHWFDLFTCMIKYLVTYIENVVLTSANLSLSMVKSITLILGITRHIICDHSVYEEVFQFLAKAPRFLSSLNQLLNKWPGKPLHFATIMLVTCMLFYQQNCSIAFLCWGMLFMGV